VLNILVAMGRIDNVVVQGSSEPSHVRPTQMSF